MQNHIVTSFELTFTKVVTCYLVTAVAFQVSVLTVFHALRLSSQFCLLWLSAIHHVIHV